MDNDADIRAVVTDLDGTIVRVDGSVSAATGTAIMDLAAARIPLIVATARTPAGLAVLEPFLRQVTIAVCCNGSIGFDPANGQQIWRHELGPIDIMSVLAEELPEAGIGVYDGRQWVLSETYYPARGKWPRGPYRVAALSALARVNACAMGICHPRLTSAQTAEILLRAGIQPEQAVLAYGADDILDVTPPGVEKAAGVTRALKTRRIEPRHAVVFGDAPNDLSMLRIAGRAVAVANAHPDVLAAATAVTSSVAEDGFSRELHRIGVIKQPESRRKGRRQ